MGTGAWVLASNNPGKQRELQGALEPFGIDLQVQGDFGVPEAEETASTFLENALIKARQAAQQTGRPALADDSGLCVDALAGAPGIHSARFAGPAASDAANVAQLLARLQGVSPARRTAQFFCALVVVARPEDPMPWVATGRWAGRILGEPVGPGGFGYDPVFFVPSMACSAAELDPEVKRRISHRGQALQSLVEQLAGGSAAGS